jgi:heme oxygenase
MSIMLRLRNETREHHERAEHSAYEQALIQGRLPQELYVAGLAQRWLIHQALEAALRDLRSARPEFATVIDDALFQTDNAAADLRYFDIDPAAVTALPATETARAWLRTLAQTRPVALLGANYVLEGSKNGARYIARSLRRAYRLEQDGLRYLDPHGEQQRGLWDAFKEQMDALALSPAEQDELIGAAQAMFDHIAAIDRAVYESGALATT